MTGEAYQFSRDTKLIVGSGVLCIVILVLVTYYPAMSIGFFGDDWFYLDPAGRLDFPEYLRFYFDPAYHSLWFRPLHGMLLRIEYALFDGNAAGYHLVQILLHLGNSLLLFAVCLQTTRRWRVALIGALLYAGFAIDGLAVYWITVHDPLAAFFYLAALLFWLRYLRGGRRPDYVLTLVVTAAALLSKEISATLPIMLFLTDRLIFAKKERWSRLIARYLAFAVMLAVYLGVESVFQSQSALVKSGYGIGSHIVFGLARYLALLSVSWLGMPSEVPGTCVEVSAFWEYLGCFWLLDRTIIYLMSSLSVLAFGIAAVRSRRRALLFWGCFVLLTVLPAAPFPEEIWGTRYLYVPAMGSAVLFAWLLEAGWPFWRKYKWYWYSLSSGIVLVMLVNSLWIADARAPLAERERQRRVPFRDIAQAHRTFPDDTYLYFVGASDRRIKEFSAMFLARYGKRVVVGGTSNPVPAKLRNHNFPLVYYFDEAGRPNQVDVDKKIDTTASPALPVNFEGIIHLEGYEITSSTIKRGGDLVLLLYWRAIGKIEKDYTVFIHLINEEGEIEIGQDGEPQEGGSRTSTWKINDFTADWRVMKIPPGALSGTNYRLHMGLYYLPTMKRLNIVDYTGRIICDTVVIEPISIIE